MKSDKKVLILLPIVNKKFIWEWKGSFAVQKVVNRMHYVMKVDGTVEVCPVNLLKRFFKREEDLMSAAIEVQMNMTGVAV